MEGVFSIGYTAFLILDFINILKYFKIRLVVDVRSQPYSNRFEDYNKENISQALARSGIYYRNYAKEFGARQTESRFFTNDGYLDFEKYARSDSFSAGFAKLDESVKSGYTIAFMCAEKNPARCHRSILVTRAFRNAGYNVKHILSGGNTESQDDIDDQLLDDYFPNRMQLSLCESKSDTELLTEAYRRRNAEIGYRLGEAYNGFTNTRIYKEISSAIF